MRAATAKRIAARVLWALLGAGPAARSAPVHPSGRTLATATAHVSPPDEDGFEWLFWSPTRGAIKGHADGRHCLADGAPVFVLPDDRFCLTDHDDHAYVERVLASKLSVPALDELAALTNITDLARVLDQYCPDNSCGPMPRTGATS